MINKYIKYENLNQFNSDLYCTELFNAWRWDELDEYKIIITEGRNRFLEECCYSLYYENIPDMPIEISYYVAPYGKIKILVEPENNKKEKEKNYNLLNYLGNYLDEIKELDSYYNYNTLAFDDLKSIEFTEEDINDAKIPFRK